MTSTAIIKRSGLLCSFVICWMLLLAGCASDDSSSGSFRVSTAPLSVTPLAQGARVSWTYPTLDEDANEAVYEVMIGWRAVLVDSNMSQNNVLYFDGDNITYEDDLCPSDNSDNNTDSDGDGIGDICEPDPYSALSFVPSDGSVSIRWRNEATASNNIAGFVVQHRIAGNGYYSRIVNASDPGVNTASGEVSTFSYSGTEDLVFENGEEYQIRVSYIYTNGTTRLDPRFIGSVVIGENTDGDALADSVDLDDDNDGILDSQEVSDAYFDYSKISAVEAEIMFPRYDSNDPVLVDLYDSQNPSYLVQGLPSQSSYIFTVKARAAQFPNGITLRTGYDPNTEETSVDYLYAIDNSTLAVMVFESIIMITGENRDEDLMPDFMDADDDNDGIADGFDRCNESLNAMHWFSNPQTDRDGDGCRDLWPQRADRYVLFTSIEDAVYVAWQNPSGNRSLLSADLLVLPYSVNATILDEDDRLAYLHIRLQERANQPFLCQAGQVSNCYGSEFALASYRQPGRRAQAFIPQLDQAQAYRYRVLIVLNYGQGQVVYFTPQFYRSSSLRQDVTASFQGGMFNVAWRNDSPNYDFFVIRIVNEQGHVVAEETIVRNMVGNRQPVSFSAGAQNMYHFDPSLVLPFGLYTVELEGVSVYEDGSQSIGYFDSTRTVLIEEMEGVDDQVDNMHYNATTLTLDDIPQFYFQSDYDKRCDRESILFVLSRAQNHDAACAQGHDRIFWASSLIRRGGVMAQVEFPIGSMVYIEDLLLNVATNFFINHNGVRLTVDYEGMDGVWRLLEQTTLTNSTSSIDTAFPVNNYARGYRLTMHIPQETVVLFPSDVPLFEFQIEEFRPNTLVFTDAELSRIIARDNALGRAAFDDGGVDYIFYDGDRDGVATDEDNCPTISNRQQANRDAEAEQARMDLAILGDACDDQDNRDPDNDNIENYRDNCPDVYNPSQDNIDLVVEQQTNQILRGDACDSLDNRDSDNDGVENYEDNCVRVPNPDQRDQLDQDGHGDACDMTDNRDTDNDGIENYEDNCPFVFNMDQADTDNNDIGDACSTQVTDADNDNIEDDQDNCPLVVNPSQADVDLDGLGDACDQVNNLDYDNDGVEDDRDNCPMTPNTDQDLDRDGDGVGDVCDGIDDRMRIFTERSDVLLSYQQDSGLNAKLILGDQSAGGSAGALRRLGSSGSGIDEGAVGQNGGGNDDSLIGTRGSDIIFGDGSGGGAGARYHRPSSSRPTYEVVFNLGGQGGSGNDIIYGGEGDDIIFGDGYDGSPSEGRSNLENNNNNFCGRRGVCDGGDGGYGGGGGGGANIRAPYYGSGSGGGFMASGGRGGLGAGAGGGIYLRTTWNNEGRYRIVGNTHCSQWFREGQNDQCKLIGRDGSSAPLDSAYHGGRGTVYDAYLGSHSRRLLDCFFTGRSVRLTDCHAVGGGGAGLGGDGGAGVATDDQNTWLATTLGQGGSTERFETSIDENFWHQVLEDIDFDDDDDDDRIWGTRAQGVGNGHDRINGGRGSDIIITGGGRDTVVLDLTSISDGSNDFDIDRVLDFNVASPQCDGDKIHIIRHVRGSVEGQSATVDTEVVTGGFTHENDIFTFVGEDHYGSYVGIVVKDGLRRADNTYRLAAIFLYDHHLDTDGERNRDTSPNDLHTCLLGE